MEREARAPDRSRGCYVVAYAEVITATGSDAVLIEGSASSPVAHLAPHGVTETVEA
ncbi:hypothetical protein ABID25_006468 [Mesorhizobium abyssinicae]